MRGLISFLVLLMGPSSSSRSQHICDLSGAFMAYPVFRDLTSGHTELEVSGAAEMSKINEEGEHFKLYIRDLTINRVLLIQIHYLK